MVNLKLVAELMFWELGSVTVIKPFLLSVLVEEPRLVTSTVYVPGSALDVAVACNTDGLDTLAATLPWAAVPRFKIAASKGAKADCKPSNADCWFVSVVNSFSMFCKGSEAICTARLSTC